MFTLYLQTVFVRFAIHCVFISLAYLQKYSLKRGPDSTGLLRSSIRLLQEGQHPLTGQRSANFRRDLEAT